MSSNDEKMLHNSLMMGGDFNTSKRYAVYMEREANERLQIIAAYSNGEKILDKAGDAACYDATLGILHIQALVREAALHNERTNSDIGNITLKKIDAIVEKATRADKEIRKLSAEATGAGRSS